MPADESRVSKSRLEALVDGIFAFAMTLLVTGLVIPSISRTEAEAVLSERIAGMLPEFFSFLMAFFILASFWLGHHRQFHYIRIIDLWIVRLTLCILACVVLIPFTTSISGDFDNVRIAVDLFHVNLFILGSLFLVQWWYLVRTPEVTNERIQKNDAIYGMRRSLIVPAISALGILVTFVSPRLSMLLYLLLIPGFFLAEYHSPKR
jgi:uncharacterized membrane protein